MSDTFFLIAAAIAIVLLYLSVFNCGELIGWWIGLTHGLLALVTLTGWVWAHDLPFKAGMAILTIYAAAMCASEILRRFSLPVKSQ